MEIQNGVVVTDSSEAILDAMIQNLENRTNDKLPPGNSAAARKMYAPVAETIAELQTEAKLVLSSVQIDNAEGDALDLLTAIINVSRLPAVAATGTVTFSRSEAATVDYTIPSGTVVSTLGADAVEFQTVKSVTLAQGTTSATVSIKCIETGGRGNVASETIQRISSSIAGPESVSNPDPTEGGREKESNRELRTRAKESLASGARGTAAAIVSSVRLLQSVNSVSIRLNDGGPDSDTSLPLNSFELIVECDNDPDVLNEVAQTIMDTKAACDTPVNGVNGVAAAGLAELDNGQLFNIPFSRPNIVNVYVDMTLSTDEDYEGGTAVRDAIIGYVGGILSTGYTTRGSLRVGDDVVYNKILSAIMSVEGVVDVSSLDVANTSGGLGTTNLSIDNTSVASTEEAFITVS